MQYSSALGQVLRTIDEIHSKLHLPSVMALLAAQAESPDAEISELLSNLNGQGILIDEGQIGILLSTYKMTIEY
jgi:6-phosphogluconate dehydrogenase